MSPPLCAERHTHALIPSPPCPLPRPGTELGGGYFSGSPLQPQCPSTFSTPTVGHRPVILVQREDGSQAPSPHGDRVGGLGTIVCTLAAQGPKGKHGCPAVGCLRERAHVQCC